MGITKFVINNFGSFKRIAAWGFNTGIYITISALFTSRYAIALGMIVMGSSSLLNALTMKKVEFISSWKGSKWIIISSIFILASVVSSFIGSEEMGFAMVRFRLYIGFLLVPLILLFGPNLTKAHYKNYLLFALSSGLIVSVLIALIYAREYETLSLILGQGQPLPTPIPHIRFGMFMSFTLLGCLFAYLQGYFHNGWKQFVLSGMVLLLASIIFLSIRTAWLISFIGIFTILLHHSVKNKTYKLLIVGSLLLASTAFLSYLSVPSVQNKVNYMIWDWKQYRTDNGVTYSDSERGYSLKNGFDLWQNNKFLGVGSGDLEEELEKNAAKLHLPVVKIPHNQFLMTAVCGGLVSLLFLIIGILSPIFIPVNRRKFILLLFMGLYLITMIFEPTFETSIGVLSYVFIISLVLKCYRDQSGFMLN